MTVADVLGEDYTSRTYNKSLDLLGKGLTSLKGSPKIVNGSFICSSNELTSLEGGPEIVNGSFSCSNNYLKSLKGGPKVVKIDYYCEHNELTSLEGAPKVVRNFSCEFNKLKTLNGSLKYVNGVFNCKNNKLTSLSGGLKEVRGSFYCQNNNLLTLKNSPKMYCEIVVFTNNPNLSSLEGLDLSDIETLNIIDTKIDIIKAIKYALKEKYRSGKIVLEMIYYKKDLSDNYLDIKRMLKKNKEEEIVYIFERLSELL